MQVPTLSSTNRDESIDSSKMGKEKKSHHSHKKKRHRDDRGEDDPKRVAKLV